MCLFHSDVWLIRRQLQPALPRHHFRWSLDGRRGVSRTPLPRYRGGLRAVSPSSSRSPASTGTPVGAFHGESSLLGPSREVIPSLQGGLNYAARPSAV